jgi:putative thioredoxin
MTTEVVLDASDATFAKDVIERSKELPVIVDFWAPWCGPCRVLGPTLEALAAERVGEVQLVKINVDENPGVATQHQVQGIPAVKAFRSGEVINEFVGALPEPQVRAFFDSLVPSAADVATAEGMQALQADEVGSARMHFEQALLENPDQQAAVVALAAILFEEGEVDSSEELALRFPDDPTARRVLAQLAFERGAGNVDRVALEEHLKVNPDDAKAFYVLGNLLAAAGEWENALEHLLKAVRLDRSVEDDGARLRMLDAFKLLGDEHELTREYRQRLMNVIF